MAKAPTVASYLSALPADRKKELAALRKVIRAHLPKGIKEGIAWGMIAYEVPLKDFPDTYNGKPLMYAAFGARKAGFTLHLPCLYLDKKLEKRFRAEYAASGKKLTMGKGCVTFRTLGDLDLDAVADSIGAITREQFIDYFRKIRPKRKSRSAAS